MLCLLYYLSGFFFLYYPAVRLPIQMKPIIPGQSVIPRQKYYLRLPPAKKFNKNNSASIDASHISEGYIR